MSSLTVAAQRESMSHGPLGEEEEGGGCPAHEHTKKLTAPFVFINIPTFQAAADAFLVILHARLTSGGETV